MPSNGIVKLQVHITTNLNNFNADINSLIKPELQNGKMGL